MDIRRFEKLYFWKNLEKVLNQFNFASWTELEGNHVKSYMSWLYIVLIMNTTNKTKDGKDKVIKF